MYATTVAFFFLCSHSPPLPSTHSISNEHTNVFLHSHTHCAVTKKKTQTHTAAAKTRSGCGSLSVCVFAPDSSKYNRYKELGMTYPPWWTLAGAMKHRHAQIVVIYL